MRARFALVVSLLLSAPGAAGDRASASRQSYVLDVSSTLLVRTWRDGARAALAHDHVVRATELAGEAVWDDDDPTALALKVTVQTASLAMDEPADRALLALDGTVPERDKKAAEEALKGRETLDVKRFPTLSFKSTRATRDKQGVLVLEGTFTMHGVSRDVRFPVEVTRAPDGTLVGTARLLLKTSDFGIRPYSAFLGAVKVKDEVELHLRLVGKPR